MGNLDADLAAHLLRLRSAHGERTAVMLLSDHGIHYGTYFDKARGGNQEHSLPLMYALFPRRVLEAHPDIEAALCMNQQRLVSPFDVHATLLHLLSYPLPPQLPKWSTSDYFWGERTVPKPASLIAPVPAARSCTDAGIPASLCPCASSDAPTTDPWS